MDIGGKSGGMSVIDIMATRRLDADFHWLSTTEDDNDRLNISSPYWQWEQQRTEPLHVKNHACILSRQKAV